MDLTEIFYAIFVFIFTYIIYWIYRRHEALQIFRRMGVPGPPPRLISGNVHDVSVCTMKPIETNERWRKEYGKVYGYFIGARPTLVVGDVELMKQVLVKDAHNFINRPMGIYELSTTFDSLLGTRGERWKEVRRVLTPTFSASKMKKLIPILNRSISSLLEVVDRHADAGEEFEIYDRFSRLTLDAIGECALATTIDCQHNEQNILYRCVSETMKGTTSMLILLLIYFPGIILLLRPLIAMAPFVTMTNELVRNLRQVLRLRRQSHKPIVDMLQLMLDTRNTTATDMSPSGEAEHEEDGLLTGSVEPDVVAGGGHRKHIKPLSDEEIVANCWVFLLAGFETTATSLAYITHILVTHQDIQERIYQEIMDNTSPDKTPTYEEAQKLQYLDQVVNETLRIYPPVVLFMARECAQDYDLGGIKIPAGMKIEIPIYSIHHDPELWPDPEKFDPERFSPENRNKIHPMAHIPFGGGPRNCIGMRFALLEVKLTIIQLLRKYRLVAGSKTKDPPEVTVPHVTYVPKNGIYLKAVPR